MGVYIEGIEMPKNCSQCFYAVHCEECAFKDIVLKGEEVIYYIGKKPENCPIKEIKNNKIKQLL